MTYYGMFLFASPFNILRDANTQEMAYRDAFVNPLIPKVFDDLNDKIRFQVGEIESTLRKQHKNQTKGRKSWVNLGSKHDGILKIYMNATEMEIGISRSERETTIYTMHRVKDILANFTIPDNQAQAYVIEEILEKAYFFKSRVMDYYVKLQEISRKAQKYSPTNENPIEASPSKKHQTSFLKSIDVDTITIDLICIYNYVL
ncbi:hypothetical protein C1645_830595 [Glomus cerebriforme]|uniref:Uncharacterized protein n=1 Tax=Glomus cerebriforme TaxID=658196 RepID=A0A397SNP2_9GLOM|nr:hypothetical protein C1645_830595 [Glomus cerebriforme]